MADPVARRDTPVGVVHGLRSQAWLIEARGPAKGTGVWIGQAPSIQVRVRISGGRAGPGPVDESEGFGADRVAQRRPG